jgi:hypothetical protein
MKVHYFKLGYITFICDRRSGIYHTVKQFLAEEYLMMAIYGRNILSKSEGEGGNK